MKVGNIPTINELATTKLQRRMALAIVGIPTVGLIIALCLLWGRGVGFIEMGILLGMYTLTVIGIGVGYHRLLAHQAFRSPTVVRAILAILGSMAFQGPVIWWVAVHRQHHSTSDQVGDPHSPNLHPTGIKELIKGLWHAHLRWMFVYDFRNTDWGKYVPDLIRDPVIFKINQWYFYWVILGLAIPAALGGIVTGTWSGAFYGFLLGGLVRIFLLDHVTWSVNSICHCFGRSPLMSHDQSKNNIWLAIPSFGEAWHNNHHAFPFSPMMGLKWWQIDLSGYVIQALERMKLAYDLKIPNSHSIDFKKVSLKKA